jgi:hypothetical protein
LAHVAGRGRSKYDMQWPKWPNHFGHIFNAKKEPEEAQSAEVHPTTRAELRVLVPSFFSFKRCVLLQRTKSRRVPLCVDRVFAAREILRGFRRKRVARGSVTESRQYSSSELLVQPGGLDGYYQLVIRGNDARGLFEVAA